MNGSERIALTVAEVARLTGMSRDTVYRLVSDGQLPAVRHGAQGKIFVPTQALERLFAIDVDSEAP